MEYKFLDGRIEQYDSVLPNSDKIHPVLLKNNHDEIVKAIDFIASNGKFLYIHGFMGTGKRQFVNYACEFLSKDVIKLEYYCRNSTVCDDILLSFIDIIESSSLSNAININAKITTLGVKLKQYIKTIKKPFLIVLHSLDSVDDSNYELVSEYFSELLNSNDNVKVIATTKALKQDLLGNIIEDKKIFLKALSKDIFRDYLSQNKISASPKLIEDFYKMTRGYYYYTMLSIKIIQAMNIQLSEFIQKMNQSGLNFDSYLGLAYINIIPTSIRNFFWFLRTIRHGISLNALAILELYDEFSIEYLKTNLMLFQVDETLYVQDYFMQKIDISIPEKTQIKLHKYIITVYERQLKESLKTRIISISRQAMRAEIEYHNECIQQIEQGEIKTTKNEINFEKTEKKEVVENKTPEKISIDKQIEQAVNLANNRKYTDAIKLFMQILDDESVDLTNVIEVRLNLAKLYKDMSNYRLASHYYELVETYYKQHNENINLNYLYYDMTDLYFKMYKNERAVETIKKVIYSVDTPQSLMVSSCTLLGNIYADMNNPEEAYQYYKKALESLDENVTENVLAELYFKFALANDDRDDIEEAFEYYNKCIAIGKNNPNKALAYSNLASCYFENENYDEAKNCFLKAYEIEKKNNNYEGIYYNASNIAKICRKQNSPKALEYLLEAKKSAEFINEPFYMLESAVALGDFYYDTLGEYKNCLKEYFTARNLASNVSNLIDISVIESRIKDMSIRMPKEVFEKFERKYGRIN